MHPLKKSLRTGALAVIFGRGYNGSDGYHRVRRRCL